MLHGLTAEVTLSWLRLPGVGNRANLMPPPAVWMKNGFLLNPRISNGFNMFAGICFNYSNW